MNPRETRPLIVGITGASGAPYARRLLHVLAAEDVPLHVVASPAGKLVYSLEIGRPLEKDLPDRAVLHDERDLAAPIASGSFPARGMVIVPCTMGTLAAVAHGISGNLLHRAADVCLKERRRLVVVPRETPLHRIHLENMLAVTDAGGIVLPAMPGFYHRPRTVDELVDFVVARVLDQFGIAQNLIPPWTGDCSS